jgi:hypothetical protein
MYLLHLTLLVLLAVNGCSSKEDSGNKSNNLYQYWIHSHEDDGDNYKAYRPKEYDFPVSRGRDGFEIKSDGQFIWSRIAPTDGHERIPGTWAWEKEGELMVATFDEGSHITRLRLTILDVSKEMLKVRIEWVHD